MSGFTKPSEAPSGVDGWKFSVDENIGSLFVIEPKREGEMDDKYNVGKTRKYIVADVTEIDISNPAKSVTYEDVWIFPAWIQGELRGLIDDGGKLLGRLGQDPDKGRGKNVAWVMEDPDDEDIEAATEWLNGRSRKALGADKKGKRKK